MRVPLSWLAEYVDTADYSVAELDAAFVRQGLEVEEIHPPAVRGPVVIGEVVSVEVLTEFKKPIRHCYVNVGAKNVDGQPRSIICGAQNFAAGDWVVVALPSAVLPGDFVIASRKTYGRLSDGMLCSTRELGLGEDHTGILVLGRDGLPAGTQPGDDAIGLLGLDETIIELAITPDRGYCLSMRGVAREISHALNSSANRVNYRDPGFIPTPEVTSEPAYPVRVDDPQGCDRFVGRVVRGIDPTTPTPAWMATRLTHAGMRPISFVVDVTNYLMLELGQPMHAFDLEKVRGPIVVRRAKAGEKLRTLDDVERVLDPQDLLITDDSGPIGLAGVMGGASTEIAHSSVDVFIECAHWEPLSVVRTVRRHKLASEAAKRFERGVDPAMAPVAAQRAVELLCELAGGRAEPRVLDIDTRPPTGTVLLDVALPGRIAGVAYQPEVVEQRLREIGCVVTANGNTLAVTPPSWRSDLTMGIELAEEVIRLEGYNEIPSSLPPASVSPGLNLGQKARRSVARSLTEHGYVEVLNYPFTASQTSDVFRLQPGDARGRTLCLANPLSELDPELRTWLLPGLLNTARRNISRGQRDIALYEIGLVYMDDSAQLSVPQLGVTHRPNDTELAALLNAVPDQPRHVAVVIAGNAYGAGWWGEGRRADWSDAIEAAQVVARASMGAEFTVHRSEMAPWHPGRCAELRLADGTVVGQAGELHPAVVAALGLPKRTCAAELSLSVLPAAELVSPKPLSNFPPTLIDVAVVVDADRAAVEVKQALAAGAGELLENIELFDVFSGAQLGAGRKSLAFALTFRAADRTLTAAEATAARDAAVAEAHRQVGAELRG